MREDICTIPINDVFAPKIGCPICRMRDMLEDRMATYITGAAMMEPNVRIETNRLGFCGEHFEQILARGSKLSIALILESLLKEIKTDIFPENDKTALKKLLATAEKRENSCFVCESVDKNIDHLLDSMLNLWQNDAEFRELYSEQEYICLKHYPKVLEKAKSIPKKNFIPFSSETTRLAGTQLNSLTDSITHFCSMFDYRSKNGDWGDSKTAIERTINYITSRDPKNEQKSEEKNR